MKIHFVLLCNVWVYFFHKCVCVLVVPYILLLFDKKKILQRNRGKLCQWENSWWKYCEPWRRRRQRRRRWRQLIKCVVWIMKYVKRRKIGMFPNTAPDHDMFLCCYSFHMFCPREPTPPPPPYAVLSFTVFCLRFVEPLCVRVAGSRSNAWQRTCKWMQRSNYWVMSALAAHSISLNFSRIRLPEQCGV